MKLTRANIEKIEAVLTSVEEGNMHRSTIIEFNIRDLPALSGFLTTLRNIGVDLPKASMSALSKRDKADFIAWLRSRKAAESSSASSIADKSSEQPDRVV